MQGYSSNQFLAVERPRLDKIESKLSTGGLALNASRTELLALELVLNYQYGDLLLLAGQDSILVRGDSGAQPWAKRVYEWGGKQFVLMMVGDMIGYVRGKPAPTKMSGSGTDFTGAP